MEVMRNHEGYHDPTAGRAIRNAAGKKQRRQVEKSYHLTYRLEEIRAFREQMNSPRK